MEDKVFLWIDWREYDEEIIKYCEKILQTGELDGEAREAENDMGFNVIIKFRGIEHVINIQEKEQTEIPQ